MTINAYVAIALPVSIVEWLDQEAERLGSKRSTVAKSFVEEAYLKSQRRPTKRTREPVS